MSAVIESKHTPGPWVVGHGVEVGRNWQPISAPYFTVVPRDGEWQREIVSHIRKEADARLIAAAPDLYGLVQGLFEAIAGEENGEYMDNSDWLVRIGDTLGKYGLRVWP